MSRDIRQVAESILSPQTMSNLPLTHSINFLTEEMIAGHRHDGRMSSVRRFFCLFVTFDLLFTSLMWLICIVMHGETLLVIFDREILHYNIKSSFFDVVVVALARFLLLILFYAIFYINNWSMIAITTAGSSTFLIGKVFMFNWPNATAPVYQVFLIISSFTLSWGEAWFLDFRVLPQEEQAKRLIQAISGQQSTTERTPLLLPHSGLNTHGESTGAYFSPIDSPSVSPRYRRPGETVILTQEQVFQPSWSLTTVH